MVITSITNAKPHLSELVDKSDTEEVILTRHGSAAAVILSSARYDSLIERLEDAEDALAAYQAEGEETIPWEEVKRQLDAKESVAA
jgi:prevent-host-death family protein